MESTSSGAAQGSSVEHAAHAQRLMKRLEACDKQLSLLLTQTADSLESLLNNSKQTAGTSEQADLGEFEDVAQDWLASVYDIQLMLRKAVRFLVRSSRPPIMTATHSFIQGGGVSAAAAGTALKAPLPSSSEAQQNGEVATSQSAGAGQDDSGAKSAELSLSALRLKHQACKELLDALEAIKATALVSESSSSSASSESDMLRLLGLHSPVEPQR
ncbi:hypothetical protein BCV69DRAFT_283322 [Microstroma glucosiphilum]|uniref:Mediator complex subunit 11 n=1 Tax=Pseudomicrostroma glucosiphilum TaxID=1684307 RepID=A0A316U5B6_9BASI|nr:hypothetical protein BCV69DRAFT_283322 [Pseudomicrostroma glucosiphilum]PWN20442.1 hypothetical protein BCV69DRAFT_283322 [Pseudomicrostroma glucosiphilum]